MFLKLSLWAERNFTPPPHRNTLLAWAKEGKIYPLPTRIGTAYYVDENAKYVDDKPRRKRLIEKIAA